MSVVSSRHGPVSALRLGLYVTTHWLTLLPNAYLVLPFDGPNYPIGNGLNLATSSTILILTIGLYVWQIADNKRREKRDVAAELAGLSAHEVEDLDWKHPAHRWKM